jgi:phospholipid/cholesterol/gamma-HCH transport system substrate-binding protein
MLRVADPARVRLRSFAGALGRAVPGLDGLLRQGAPVVSYMTPFSREVGALMANMGAFNGVRDRLGTKGRILNYVDEATLSLLTDQQQRAIKALGLKALQRFHENSYPAPGTVGTPQPFGGSFPQLEASPRPR